MTALTLVENKPARKSLALTGHTEEGVLRSSIVYYDERHDAIRLSLRRSDLEIEEPHMPDRGKADFTGLV